MVHGMGMVGAHLRCANHGHGITATGALPCWRSPPRWWLPHPWLGWAQACWN